MTLDDPVTITITKAEALVLLDLLVDFRDSSTLLIRHEAERATLWTMGARLEKVLAEPFLENYEHILTEAREKVSARAFGGPDA